MNWFTKFANNLAGISIGISLFIVALLFVSLGITFLPIIGILVAIPVIRLSFSFLNLKNSVVGEKSTEASCQEGIIIPEPTVRWFELTAKEFG